MRSFLKIDLLRKPHILFFTAILLAPLVQQNVLYGQMLTSTADATDTVEMASKNKKVPVFVYNTPKDGAPKSGKLTVSAPEGQAYDIVWGKYNPAINIFETFASETGNVSTVENLEEGGYSVLVTDTSGVTDSLYALVYQNEFDAEIVNKGPDGKLYNSSRYCGYFTLEATASQDTLRYSDFFNHTDQELVTEIDSIDWSHTSDDAEFPKINSEKLELSVHNPLVEDATFYLTVVDKYGSERRDTVEFEAIAVRADFVADPFLVTEMGKEGDDFYSKYYTTDKNSAPHKVWFENKSSSKVDSVFWRFGDDSIAHGIDTLWHTYVMPGNYTPTLIVLNEKGGGCLDSMQIDKDIEVDGAEFKMPNFLNIGAGNVFRSFDISVTYIEIVIVSRWGQKVHEYAGDIREWRGWDGKIKDSNRYVQSGVYYYVINDLRGYDEAGEPVEYSKKSRKGFLHVYNSSGM